MRNSRSERRLSSTTLLAAVEERVGTAVRQRFLRVSGKSLAAGPARNQPAASDLPLTVSFSSVHSRDKLLLGVQTALRTEAYA